MLVRQINYSEKISLNTLTTKLANVTS